MRTRLLRAALLFPLLIASRGGSAQVPVLAITNVTLLDGTDAAPRRDVTVVVTGTRISAIGPSSRTTVPKGARVVDGRNQFLIPGLWDMHVHLGAYDAGVKASARLLSYGVTGVRDMASPLDDILRLRRETDTGAIVGPSIVAAGPILQRPLPFALPPLVRTVTEADAARTVGELRERGVDFIKVGDTLTRSAYLSIARESTRLRLPFAGHLPAEVTAAEASDAGQRSIEHFGSAVFRNVLMGASSDEEALGRLTRDALATALGGGPPPDVTLTEAAFTNRLVDSYDARKGAALFARFVRNRTWHVPTILALRSVWDERRARLNAAAAAADQRAAAKTLAMFGEMRRAGVRVLAGSDLSVEAGVPRLHDELAALVEAGLTPLQALQASTRDAAEFLGRTATTGTVAAGKNADLVLLDANPLTDIANARRVNAVIRSGRVFTAADLQSLRQ
jgi:hypothetical protein